MVDDDSPSLTSPPPPDQPRRSLRSRVSLGKTPKLLFNSFSETGAKSNHPFDHHTLAHNHAHKDESLAYTARIKFHLGPANVKFPRKHHHDEVDNNSKGGLKNTAPIPISISTKAVDKKKKNPQAALGQLKTIGSGSGSSLGLGLGGLKTKKNKKPSKTKSIFNRKKKNRPTLDARHSVCQTKTIPSINVIEDVGEEDQEEEEAVQVIFSKEYDHMDDLKKSMVGLNIDTTVQEGVEVENLRAEDNQYVIQRANSLTHQFLNKIFKSYNGQKETSTSIISTSHEDLEGNNEVSSTDPSSSVTLIEDTKAPWELDMMIMCDSSKIISLDIAREISKSFPKHIQGYDWDLAYSTVRDGAALSTLFRKCKTFPGEMVLIIKSTEADIFGGFTSKNWEPTDLFDANESFLFKVLRDKDKNDDGDDDMVNTSKTKSVNNNNNSNTNTCTDVPNHLPVIKVFPWTEKNLMCQRGSLDGLQMGASGGHFGLSVAADLLTGRTYKCDTYGNDILCGHQYLEFSDEEEVSENASEAAGEGGLDELNPIETNNNNSNDNARKKQPHHRIQFIGGCFRILALEIWSVAIPSSFV